MKSIEFFSRGGFGKEWAAASKADVQSPQWRVSKGLDGIGQLAAEFHSEVYDIRSDNRLSPEGKSEAVAKLAEPTLKKLITLHERFLPPALGTLKTLQAKLSTPRPDNDNLADLLRQIETRSVLKSLDGKERLAIFNKAIEEDDRVTFAAFDQAPPGMNLIKKEMLNDGRLAMLAKKDPAAAHRLNAMSDIVPILCDVLARFYQDLAVFEGVDPDVLAEKILAIPNIPHRRNSDYFRGMSLRDHARRTREKTTPPPKAAKRSLSANAHKLGVARAKTKI